MGAAYYDFVRWLALDVSGEAHTAGILLILRVVKTLLDWQSPGP